jgi:hypothetical protein
MRVGGLLVVPGVVLCVKRCPSFCYGVYGRKIMAEVFRTVREFWRRLKLYFLILCIFGQLLLFLIL